MREVLLAVPSTRARWRALTTGRWYVGPMAASMGDGGEGDGPLGRATNLPVPIPETRVPSPVTDAHRDAALALLRETLATDDLSLDVFSSAVSAIYAAESLADISAVVQRYAPPVRMTPAERRLKEPLVVETTSGTLRLVDSWQVPATTRVSCGSGRVHLDLTDAEFDQQIVDFDLRTQSGTIEMVVPHAADVQFVRMKGRSGSVDNRITGGGLLPAPVRIRISADTSSGRIVVRRPSPPKPPRRRWFRRRASTVG